MGSLPKPTILSRPPKSLSFPTTNGRNVSRYAAAPSMASMYRAREGRLFGQIHCRNWSNLTAYSTKGSHRASHGTPSRASMNILWTMGTTWPPCSSGPPHTA